MSREKVLELLHEVRGHLQAAQELVHLHMSGDWRFTAEKELHQAQERAAQACAWCMSCSPEEKEEP